MRAVVLASMILAVLSLLSCEHRAPLTPGQAVGLADTFQRREGLAWGEPIEVLTPAADADVLGHRWWQLRYASAGGGAARVVVVDDATGWARLPPPGYLVRVAPTGKPGAANPVVVADGHSVLAVVPLAPADAERRTALEREVVRLNALAGESGLMPLFSLKDGGEGRFGIVYGWQGDRGIARDDRVIDWMNARTPYRGCAWVDLTQP
jgi:hypothetical protein